MLSSQLHKRPLWESLYWIHLLSAMCSPWTRMANGNDRASTYLVWAVRERVHQECNLHFQFHYTHHIQGSQRTWKTWNFVIFFSKFGKSLEFVQKVVKTWKKLEICKFYVLSFTFQDVIYKNKSDLLLFHFYIINTNTDSKPNCPWI